MDFAQHIRIKKLYGDVEVPSYRRPGDAGLDLFSREDWVLQPGEQHLFRLGVSIALPEGTVGLIWDRSGLAAKNGVTSLGGVIDHTYRGELGVVLVNVTKIPYEVKKGDRIAQLLMQPILTAEIQVVDELDETQRGLGSFGSSGR